MTKNRLYLFTMLVATAGIAWLAFNYNRPGSNSAVDLCLFRRATGLPCPSCGTTRSVLSLMHLRFTDAWHFNPFGFVMLVALCLAPAWVLLDLATGKDSFHRTYLRTEKVVRSRWLASLLVCIVLVNWAWNIYKYTS